MNLSVRSPNGLFTRESNFALGMCIRIGRHYPNAKSSSEIGRVNVPQNIRLGKDLI